MGKPQGGFSGDSRSLTSLPPLGMVHSETEVERESLSFSGRKQRVGLAGGGWALAQLGEKKPQASPQERGGDAACWGLSDSCPGFNDGL